MARITVEDCLEYTHDKFELTAIATKRARQLAGGAYTELDWEDDKPTVMALREIAAGLVSKQILSEPDMPVDPAAEMANLSESVSQDSDRTAGSN